MAGIKEPDLGFAHLVEAHKPAGFVNIAGAAGQRQARPSRSATICAIELALAVLRSELEQRDSDTGNGVSAIVLRQTLLVKN